MPMFRSAFSPIGVKTSDGIEIKKSESPSMDNVFIVNPTSIVEQVFIQPTNIPTSEPTNIPTSEPTNIPTSEPTNIPAEFSETLRCFISFYDPNIGLYFPDVAKVNCPSWNGDSCPALTASGQDYRLWYGKGVACPPPISLGAIILVLEPEELRGEWVCIDRGLAIENNVFDFLLKYPDDIWTGYNLNKFWHWASNNVLVYQIREAR